MKGKVKINAEKQFQEYRGSGAWLNSALPFNPNLRLTEEQKARVWPVFESCKIRNRKENVFTFEILMANLFWLKGLRPVIVSLSPNEWKKTRYNPVGSSVIGMIHKLKEEGYLGMALGYRTEKESRQTRIWATEKLLEYFQELPNNVVYEPTELVELRDEKRRLKEYKDTIRTRQIRAILKRANQVNQAADIRYHGYKLSPFLYAVFIRKFTLYGRLHTRGYRHYQGFSEEERREITINGDSVVELDYSGLHPHLLYAKEGIQFFGDPYSIVDSRPEARPFLKSILLSMLNAKDEITAERAANYWLYENHEERDKLAEIGITRARPLMQAFRERHKKIAHYFCSGKDTGLKIMNLDATIALDIIDYFAKQGIPILAIHDSFIVQEQYKDELHITMRKIYRKHTGFRISVK